jgi:serine protease AprX
MQVRPRAIAFLSVLLLGSLVWGNDHKLSPDLKGRHSGDAVDVIVQFKVAPAQKHRDRITAHGGLVKQHLSTVKGLLVRLPASRLQSLSNDPDVAYVSPDRPISKQMNNAALGVLANYAWSLGYDGTGIAIAVVDSGVHSVDDLKDAQGHNRILFNYDSLGGGADDQYGHGTHVAGIIGGSGKDSVCSNCDVTIRGIAPNVSIINFHALGQQGQGTDSSVINAINKAIQLKSQYNIRVMNLSLGRPVYETYALDPLCQAVEAAWKAGIVVVVAAGNDGRANYSVLNGYGTITAPGNDPYVITVGAMNTKGTPDRSDDVMASYSSKGPSAIDHVVKPDLVAPGNRVVSLQTGGYLQKNYPGNRPAVSYYQTGTSGSVSGKYFILSGTSMATAVVSGGAALLIQKNPTFTPAQVKALLMKTAYKSLPQYSTVTDAGVTYTIQYDAFTVGAGYLDLQAAISSAEIPATTLTAQSPTATYDATCGCVYFAQNDSTLGGTNALWGSNALWGTNLFVGAQNALWGSNALWGGNALWGSSSLDAFNALWGTNALWGSSVSNATQSLSVDIGGEN